MRLLRTNAYASGEAYYLRFRFFLVPYSIIRSFLDSDISWRFLAALDLYLLIVVTSLERLPLYAVSPICCRHLAFGNVLGVTGFESLVAGSSLWGTFDTLLPEANQFDLATRFGKYGMGFLWVVRCRFRLVVASKTFTSIVDTHWRFAQALSTRFGYGRPASAARRLAAAFCLEVRDLDLLFGFFLSQNAFLPFATTSLRHSNSHRLLTRLDLLAR